MALSARLRSLAPEQVDRFDDVMSLARTSVDPVLLDLVRLRIAHLLGHPDAGETLADWPTSPIYDERERDCLAFAEQFVIDVAGFTDEDIASVDRHFSAGEFYCFVNAVYLTDFGLRLEMASHALLPTPS